jgi:hypothetical protein
MKGDKLQDAYMEALLQRVTGVRYPSKELMDRVENLAHKPEYAEQFVGYLIESVENVQYPSHQIMDRIARILFGTVGR